MIKDFYKDPADSDLFVDWYNDGVGAAIFQEWCDADVEIGSKESVIFIDVLLSWAAKTAMEGIVNHIAPQSRLAAMDRLKERCNEWFNNELLSHLDNRGLTTKEGK